MVKVVYRGNTVVIWIRCNSSMDMDNGGNPHNDGIKNIVLGVNVYVYVCQFWCFYKNADVMLLADIMHNMFIYLNFITSTLIST